MYGIAKQEYSQIQGTKRVPTGDLTSDEEVVFPYRSRAGTHTRSPSREGIDVICMPLSTQIASKSRVNASNELPSIVESSPVGKVG